MTTTRRICSFSFLYLFPLWFSRNMWRVEKYQSGLVDTLLMKKRTQGCPASRGSPPHGRGNVVFVWGSGYVFKQWPHPHATLFPRREARKSLNLTDEEGREWKSTSSSHWQQLLFSDCFTWEKKPIQKTAHTHTTKETKIHTTNTGFHPYMNTTHRHWHYFQSNLILLLVYNRNDW